MRRGVPTCWLILAAGAAAMARGQGVPDLSIVPPAAVEVPRAKWTFTISAGAGQGDAVYIPITVLGKERLFVVDTGCEVTLLDEALTGQLTATSGARNLDAFGGKVRKSLYLAPVLEALGRRLPTSKSVVATADLTPFREIVGKPIEGILGMDVLRKLVVRLDCRGRTLTLEEPAGFEAPTGAGVSSHDIVYVSGVPSATMELLGLPAQRWGFDMGAAKSFAVVAAATGGALETFTLRSEASAAADLVGEYQSKALEVRREWSFGGTRYTRVRVDVAPRVPVDLLGLEFFADYAVTFDFPHGRLYLASGAAEHVSRRSLGFGATVREGRYLVRDPNPEIAALDVREGDELVAANGAPIAGREPWAVAKELRESVRPTITLKRGERTITVALPREEAATRPGGGK